MSDQPDTPNLDGSAAPSDGDLIIATAALERLIDADSCWRSTDDLLGKCGSGSNCPYCTAKHALASIQGWRYVGNLPARIFDGRHPRETAMHEAWSKYFSGHGTPDGKLRQVLHDEIWPSRRDWYVASSIVRWLATNVGSQVLEEAGWVHEDRLTQAQQSNDQLRRLLNEKQATPIPAFVVVCHDHHVEDEIYYTDPDREGLHVRIEATALTVSSR